MARRSDRRRRVGRRNYVGERASTTKVQLLMACGLLGMLLALGPSLSQGAAGCFHAVSGTGEEPVQGETRRQPPTTRVRIDDIVQGPEAGISSGGQLSTESTDANSTVLDIEIVEPAEQDVP